MTREDLVACQWDKLARGLDEVFASNPFYRRKYSDAAVDRAAVASLADLVRLPFCAKEELLADQERNPPFGSNLTYPLERYARVHQTSGTGGRRLRWPDTLQSWSWILDCWDRIYEAVGLRADDRLFFPFSFGPFLGFWAAFEGAARLGRFVLPGGGMTTSARLAAMRDYQITIVLSTPTYALRLIEAAAEEAFPLAQSSVRALILAGEPGAMIPSVRRRIQDGFRARVYDHSGMTEAGSLGIEFECLPEKLFLLEDHAIFEFIDPQTQAPVAEGELGELVLTNLGRWGSPLIRYRTGDLVRWRRDVHPESYPFVYLDGGILGRTDDMIWVKGNNVYPSAIEAVLREFDDIAEFLIEAEGEPGSMSVTVVIEPRDPGASAAIEAAASKALADRLYFRPKIRIAPPGSLPRSDHKGRRFVRKP